MHREKYQFGYGIMWQRTEYKQNYLRMHLALAPVFQLGSVDIVESRESSSNHPVLSGIFIVVVIIHGHSNIFERVIILMRILIWLLKYYESCFYHNKNILMLVVKIKPYLLK